MTGDVSSVLIKKLTVSNLLETEDIDAIRRLPIRVRSLRARDVIAADGQRPEDSCLIVEGFAYRSKTTFQGERQVLSIHIPGEIPDLQSLHLHVMDHDLMTLTPCTVGFIAHSALQAMNVVRPNLAAAFWRESLIDAAIFREWLVNLGRRSAASRMAHLFLELYHRLAAVGRASAGEFELPVTQSDLADCLGLSSVHVNRVLQELRRDGLIEARRSAFHIIDMQKMVALAEFDSTYLHLDPAI